jgi:hypothetical protein
MASTEHTIPTPAPAPDPMAHAMVRLARWAATLEAIYVAADAKGLRGRARTVWVTLRRAECMEPF